MPEGCIYETASRPSVAFACLLGDNLDHPELPLVASGPGSIPAVTLPNYITFSRIVAVPLFLDGYLARRRGQITTLGMLLDPLADKLLITAALVTLVQFNPALVPAWIAVLVIGREFLVSGLRSIASSEGFTLEASDLGKYKMFVQIVSVVAVILDHRWHAWYFGPITIPVHWIALLAVGAMILMSVWSAVDYFIAFWSKIDRQAVKRRRRSFILSRRKAVVAASRQPSS